MWLGEVVHYRCHCGFSLSVSMAPCSPLSHWSFCSDRRENTNSIVKAITCGMKKNASINNSFKRCPPGTARCVFEPCTRTVPSLSNCRSKQQWQNHIFDGTHKTFERAQSQRRHHQTLPSQTGCDLPKRWA